MRSRVLAPAALIVNRDAADSMRLAKEDELMRLSRQWGAA
jgi:hypothetical protein